MRRKILSVLLCCLTLCSCGNSSDSTISITTTTTTKTESSVENATPPTDIGNEVSVGIGINYPEGATNLEFDGEKVAAEISLDCDNADTELGLLIYVEGMVQKYSVYENQEEKTMHTFNLKAGETKTVMVEFDPIVGKKGDNLNVIFGIMLNPSFVAEDENRTYGNNHKINTLGIQKLVMKADGQNSEVLSSEKYDCEEMTEEFKSKYVIFNEDGSLYRNKLEWLNDVIVLSKEESSIVKPGESIVYQLFGGQESTYTVGLYVNNQLVTDAFDGKPYVEIKTKADTVSSVTVDIDSLQLKNNDCISFIAIPKEVSERELYKSVNITYIED